MLRLCRDKVLLNMSDIHSLRDILDRLRSVARTNGLRFHLLLDKKTLGSETCCQISGDLFDVDIVLDGSDNHLTGPDVLDVKITYSNQVKSSPELVEIIRNGRFLDLSKHLKMLIELYPLSLDRQTKTKVYMALQSLEADVNKMSQLYIDSYKDADYLNIVMHGLVGLLSPHVMGMCLQLRYFLSPYNLLDIKKESFAENLGQLDETKGLHAQIGIKSHSTPRSLPISPLISNNHPVSGSGKPRFLDVNQHNSVSLPACFVLKLKPKVLLIQQIATKIEKETGMELFEKNATMNSYFSLLKKEEEVGEVIMDVHKQIYKLNVKHFKAAFVDEILFTHPGHLVSILTSLRKQAYLNHLFSSCIRPKQISKNTITSWHYDISLEENMTNLHVTFQHPLLSSSTAFAEISLSGDGFTSCHLFSGRSDPFLCSDEYALTVLQKSFSLPILMRAIILQTKRSPRKEPDRHRSSRQSIYQHRATTVMTKKAPPLPLPPVCQNQPIQQSVNVPSSPVPISTATTTSKSMFQTALTPMVVDHTKKETQHPMLTQLLKPQLSSGKLQNATVQPKSHPMLLGLLKENEAIAKDMPQQQQLQQAVPMPQQQHLQQAMPQQLQQAASQRQAYQQHAVSPQLTLSYGQQVSQQQPQDQMPPPPSYYSAGQAKSMPQQQFQMQQQQISSYSNPSPLGFEEPAGGPPSIPSLHSPYNVPSNNSHSSTPPLFGMIPSPSSSQTSPMTFTPSPRQPPMNTPQPLPITSPRHSSMTPPMHSPAARKVSLGRRGSRQKSRSIDQSGFDARSEVMSDVAFPSAYDINTESDNNQIMEMQDVFGADLSPAFQTITSPAVSSTQSQRHLSGDRGFNFSFESDLLEADASQRRNSSSRRSSNQPFMTPSPTLSTQESQDTAFPMPSPASSVDNFQPSFTIADSIPAMTDVQQTHSFGKKVADVQGNIQGYSDSKNFQSEVPESEQMEADPFNFDDNKTPQKISMPDSVSDQKGRAGISSRSSSISSSSGPEDTTLKGLLTSVPGTLTTNLNKAGKIDKLTSHQAGKAAGGAAGQRRGSMDFCTSGSLSGDSGSASISGHKPLVRQNAIGRGSHSKFPLIQNEAKEKTKKRFVKDDKGPRKRGRPPSTDKKEHSMKRKKIEGFAEDSEQRGKIVLNVQLNKGTPISSTTKTKPVPAEIPTEKAPPTSITTSSTPPSSAVDPHKLDNIQHDSPLLKNYFRDQTELEKKKKEKKFASGASSPMPSVNKISSKSTGQTGSGLAGNPSLVRGQSASAKSMSGIVSGAVKSSKLLHQKSGPAISQSKAGYRARKSSIKDVTAILTAKAESVQSQHSTATEKRLVSGSAITKGSDRPGSSDQVASTVKLKGVQPPSGTKFAQLVVSKPQGGDEREVAVKASAPSKLVMSKSPGNHLARTPVQTKRDRSRPVTPIRDPKICVPMAAALKSQPSILSTGKLSKTLDGLAAQSKSVSQIPDSAKRPIPSRPPSSNKSPRSITPPQARHLPQVASAQPKADRIQSTLGKRSPGQAIAVPRRSPRSPEDRLVIDDGSDDVSSVPSQVPSVDTSPTPQPPPLTHNVNVPTIPLVSMAPPSNDFSVSPSVPCEIDDDLMNAALLP